MTAPGIGTAAGRNGPARLASGFLWNGVGLSESTCVKGAPSQSACFSAGSYWYRTMDVPTPAFARLFEWQPFAVTVNVEKLSLHVGLTPRILASRAVRAGLPMPKTLTRYAQMLWLAWLLENPERSFACSAYLLGAASPQSLGRTVKDFTGLSVVRFRQTYTAENWLTRFRGLVLAQPRRRWLAFP